MAKFTDADADVLAPPRDWEGFTRKPYRNRGMPDSRDDQIDAILSRIEGPDDFADLLAMLNACGDDRMIVDGERHAELAVNCRSLEYIRLGLVANALAYGNTRDWRDIMGGLPLLYRAAELINVDPPSIFTAAASIVGATPTKWGSNADDWLLSFARRKPEDRSLKAFLYVEEQDESGFRFRRTW